MEKNRIDNELQHALDGDPWHGSSLLALLADVDAAAAAARPIPNAHSIWEIVLHAAAWAGEVARRLRGSEPQLPAEGDWPTVPEPTPAAWEQAQARLVEAHADLRRALKSLPEERLDEKVGTTRNAPLGTGSYYYTLHGLAQHDAYHGGQIALLKKAWTSSR